MKLNIRRTAKKRLPERIKLPLSVPQSPNQMWSLDFMSDIFTDNRKFRFLNIVDDFNRECLEIEADTSLPAQRVIRVLDRLIVTKSKPANLRCDNGPEFISHALQAWCESHRIYPTRIPYTECLYRKNERKPEKRTAGYLSIYKPPRGKRLDKGMAPGLQL